MPSGYFSPLSIVTQVIRSRLAAVKITDMPVYIGQLPNEKNQFVSISLGESQGLEYGYGNVAYRNAEVVITIRGKSYEWVDEWVSYIIATLCVLPNLWVSSISPVSVVRQGVEQPESVEMSIRANMILSLSQNGA